MTLQHHRITALACTLAALLMAGASGPASLGIACFCPEGQVTVVTASVCGCCLHEKPDSSARAWNVTIERASCNNCVDLPLHLLAPAIDSERLQKLVSEERTARLVPGTPAVGSQRLRPGGPDQLCRTPLALLASVILLT